MKKSKTSSLICPHCNTKWGNLVVDSRVEGNGTYAIRRRECGKCLKRFTTFEQHDRMPESIEYEIAELERLAQSILKIIARRKDRQEERNGIKNPKQD